MFGGRDSGAPSGNEHIPGSEHVGSSGDPLEATPKAASNPRTHLIIPNRFSRITFDGHQVLRTKFFSSEISSGRIFRHRNCTVQFYSFAPWFAQSEKSSEKSHQAQKVWNQGVWRTHCMLDR